MRDYTSSLHMNLKKYVLFPLKYAGLAEVEDYKCFKKDKYYFSDAG